MEYRQLKIFIQVAETGSFSRAAQRCSITQGAVSYQIKALEDELKAQLIKRHSHSLSLTDTGCALLIRAKAAVRSMEDCYNSVADVNNMLTGELNIGVGSFIAPYIELAAAKFMTDHPNVRMNAIFAQAKNLNTLLRDQEIDMAFTTNIAYHDEPIDSTPCISYHLRAVMGRSHPLAGKSIITKDDVLTHDIILPDAGQRVFSSIGKYVDIDFSKLRIRATVTDAAAAMTMANNLNLLTFLPELYVRTRPYLVALPIEGFSVALSSNVHFLKNCPKKPSAEAFLRLIKDYSMPILSAAEG